MKSNELYPKSVSKILGEKFYIPEYQRGYRWNKRQVVNMLDDIYEFYLDSRNKDSNVFYCLQPIVVKKNGDEWELIDGQQRITTLHLILTYFNDLMTIFKKDPVSLRYETRPHSADFLNKIDMDRKEENIDFHHICEAYDAIEEWFDDKDGTLKSNLLQTIVQPDDVGKNVKVIWYEVHEDVDSIEIFTRLNVGKIPLTNAELVKALFLRKNNLDSTEVNLLQLKIAQEWDMIEKKLHGNDFWYFISNTNEYSCRIEYILKLMADEFCNYLRECEMSDNVPQDPKTRFLKKVSELILKNGNNDFSLTLENDDPYYVFFVFNKLFELTGKQTEYLWMEIKKYFMMFEEWHENRYFFHIIGFLIKSEMPVADIMSKANASDTKCEFKQKLKKTILKKLEFEGDVTEENVRDYIESLSYNSNSERIRKVLLLFNILSLIEDPMSNTRFQFDAYSEQSANGGWDLEHIHSVASGKPEKVNERKQWLRNVFEYLGDDDDMAIVDGAPDDALLRQSILNILGTEPFDPQNLFDSLYSNITLRYGEPQTEIEGVDNSIANLTLLDAATNRSYKNAIFPIKRVRIIDLDKKATFVPLCTKNVFLKYYSQKADKMFRWDKTDRDDYSEAIIDCLSKFFAK